MLESMLIIVLLLALGILGGYTLGYRHKAHNQITALRVELARKDRTLGDAERRLTEQADSCRQGTIMMAALGGAAYDALMVVDERRVVLACNRNTARLFNCDQPVGKPLLDVTAMPELDALVGDVLIHEAEVLEEQMTIDMAHYNVKARVLRENGQVLVGLALRDITRLVRLNRARRDMVANISHELRTPIANIRLIIDGLFHDRDRPRRKDSIQSLRDIARETDSLLWLVQEMSDLSMIESGQALVRMVDVRLRDLVDDAMLRLEDLSGFHEITLETNIPEDYHVLCDHDLIQRVLVNLVHNALKWSPKGGKVRIKAHQEGEEIVISVLDKGAGVPEDQVDRIFERFYQVDASRSGREGGTGLGLAICRHIVEAHGGRIWAEGNADGGGGKFRFTLLNAENAVPEAGQEGE